MKKNRNILIHDSRQEATHKNKNIYCNCTYCNSNTINYIGTLLTLRSKYSTYGVNINFFYDSNTLFWTVYWASSTSKTGIIFCQIEMNENQTKYCLKNKEKRKKEKKFPWCCEALYFRPLQMFCKFVFCHQYVIKLTSTPPPSDMCQGRCQSI